MGESGQGRGIGVGVGARERAGVPDVTTGARVGWVGEAEPTRQASGIRLRPSCRPARLAADPVPSPKRR